MNIPFFELHMALFTLYHQPKRNGVLVEYLINQIDKWCIFQEQYQTPQQNHESENKEYSHNRRVELQNPNYIFIIWCNKMKRDRERENAHHFDYSFFSDQKVNRWENCNEGVCWIFRRNTGFRVLRPVNNDPLSSCYVMGL